MAVRESTGMAVRFVCTDQVCINLEEGYRVSG